MKRVSKGFTLVEVAVAAALLAILAAATVPSFVEYLEQRDIETTAKTLSAIATGIVSFETNVKTSTATTNTYPGKISYLTNSIATSDLNSCGAAWSGVAGGTANLLTNYNASAPFTSFYIPAGGFQTPVGTIQDAITRTPATANVGIIGIVMPSIDSVDAMRLERYIDGTDINIAASRTSGTFRVNSTAFPKMSVSYVVPAAAKC